MLQERVPGLVEQRLQRVGVGGVAGLGPLGLRHLQLVEQHHLQLLGRAEVDLLADHGVGRLGGVADLVAELALQRSALVQVDGDADAPPWPASTRCTGSSISPSSAVESMRSSSSSSASARSTTARARRIGGLHRLLVDALAVVEKRKLLLLRCFRAQLAAQVAQRQVVEGEAALPGPHQVGGQRGVGGDAVQRPAAARRGRGSPAWPRAAPWASPGSASQAASAASSSGVSVVVST